jgi:hypothetical protein
VAYFENNLVFNNSFASCNFVARSFVLVVEAKITSFINSFAKNLDFSFEFINNYFDNLDFLNHHSKFLNFFIH